MTSNQLHPNGVLPGGNAFVLGEKAYTVRNAGLGTFLSRLTDEKIMDLLAFVDGHTMGRICMVSKVLYVFGHVDNLWRDLVLLQTNGKHINFTRSWKETYSTMHSKLPIPTIIPLKVKGFFSQYLFHHFLC